MTQCPNCKSTLNSDEKASGKCFTCGMTFESSLSRETTASITKETENTIGKALKIIGILILIVGTVGNFITSFHDAHGIELFSFVGFVLPEAAILVSGTLFLGFSEIIVLLQDISNKLK